MSACVSVCGAEQEAASSSGSSPGSWRLRAGDGGWRMEDGDGEGEEFDPACMFEICEESAAQKNPRELEEKRAQEELMSDTTERMR
ncbi:unnamed protein product [Pleuronectes platessa]|uniref:Uncharacterized protein n=1 Tax=Pleuronectes platessa TaxID=8262 RepID=A0A9N7VRN8_PLEPL|nr:unnamed protein product [Pleuronectes platessa]